MRVEPGRSAGSVVGLLQVDAQRFSQSRRRRVVLGKRAEGARDELGGPAGIVGRERGDLKFPIGAETTAGRVAQQQPMHGQRGLVAGAKPFDAAAGRADGDTHRGR